VYEALKAADYKPIIDSSNGQVTVPTDRYHAARDFLASKGLPENHADRAWMLLKDQSALTTSQFMEQARYNAAMEQELRAASCKSRPSRLHGCIWPLPSPRCLCATARRQSIGGGDTAIGPYRQPAASAGHGAFDCFQRTFADPGQRRTRGQLRRS
jgi:hypothetical protein